MHDFNPLADHNIAKDWKKREDSRHGRLSIYDEEGNMVYLEAVGEISDSTTTFIGVGDYHHLVTSIDKLGGKLIDMTFDSAGLREEEIADHGNIVWHLGSSMLSFTIVVEAFSSSFASKGTSKPCSDSLTTTKVYHCNAR